MNDNDIRFACHAAQPTDAMPTDAMPIEIGRLIEMADRQGRTMPAYLLRIALAEAEADSDDGNYGRLLRRTDT